MTRHAKLLMTVLTALLLLTLGAGTSFALRSLSLEGERLLTLTGRVTAQSEAATITCNVTIEKTVSRTFPKVIGILIGKVTGYRVANCRSETVIINRITPLGLAVEELWRIFYKEYLGILPRITGILFEWRHVQKLIEFTVIGIPIGCLYEGTVNMLANVREGFIERLRTLDEQPALIEKNLVLDLTSSGLCPRRIRLRYELTPGQNTRVLLL